MHKKTTTAEDPVLSQDGQQETTIDEFDEDVTDETTHMLPKIKVSNSKHSSGYRSTHQTKIKKNRIAPSNAIKVYTHIK